MARTAEPTAAPDLEALLAQWLPFITKFAKHRSEWLGFEHEEFRADVIANIVRSFPRFDPSRGAFSTWAVLIIRQTYQRSMARRTRAPKTRPLVRPDRGTPGDEREFDLPADPTSPDPVKEAEGRDLREVVAEALDELTAEQREAVEVAFFGRDDPCLTRYGRDRLREALAVLRERLPDPNEVDRVRT